MNKVSSFIILYSAMNKIGCRSDTRSSMNFFEVFKQINWKRLIINKQKLIKTSNKQMRNFTLAALAAVFAQAQVAPDFYKPMMVTYNG